MHGLKACIEIPQVEGRSGSRRPAPLTSRYDCDSNGSDGYRMQRDDWIISSEETWTCVSGNASSCGAEVFLSFAAKVANIPPVLQSLHVQTDRYSTERVLFTFVHVCRIGTVQFSSQKKPFSWQSFLISIVWKAARFLQFNTHFTESKLTTRWPGTLHYITHTHTHTHTHGQEGAHNTQAHAYTNQPLETISRFTKAQLNHLCTPLLKDTLARFVC